MVVRVLVISRWSLVIGHWLLVVGNAKKYVYKGILRTLSI